MNENEALAVCFANLKGPKDKQLLTTARALAFLKRLPKYGSNAKVGQAVGVSREVVREFLTLLQLPTRLHPLFEQNKLGLEQGRKLWQLGRQRSEILDDVAKTLTQMKAHDSRALIDYVLKNPGISVSEATETIIRSRGTIEREYHVIALLSEEDYGHLVKSARNREVPADELVTLIVREWLGAEHADG